MSKKILITGGSGLVGTYLKEFLPNAVYVSSKDYNLIDQLQVFEMFKKVKPRTVIHLAAKVGGIHDNIHEPVKYFENNILINTFVLKEAFKNKVDNFIGILSSCIYPDKVENYPIKESELHNGAPHDDLFSYSYAKRCLAVQIDMYNKKFDKNYNYLIPCNLYGEYDKFDPIKGHFVGALIEKIIYAKKNKKKEIVLFGDGSPYRQFMHARDLAKIIYSMVKKKLYLNLNVATKENYKVDEIAKIALTACEAENLKIIYDNKKPNGQFRKDIDISLLKKNFPDFNPISLKEGIREVYQKRSINLSK